MTEIEEINLENVSSDRLRNEIYKREQTERDKADTKALLLMQENWKNRPSSPVIGRAYGFYPNKEWLSYRPLPVLSLARVTIEGNTSCTYGAEYYDTTGVEIPSSVKTYFHNAWTELDRQEFKKQIIETTEKFLIAKLNDPIVLTTLIGLSDHNCGVPDWMQRDLEVAQEETLHKFSKAELEVALKYFRETHSSHGEEGILERAIKTYGENK